MGSSRVKKRMQTEEAAQQAIDPFTGRHWQIVPELALVSPATCGIFERTGADVPYHPNMGRLLARGGGGRVLRDRPLIVTSP